MYLKLLKVVQETVVFSLGTPYIHTPVCVHETLLAPFYLSCAVFWSVSY